MNAAPEVNNETLGRGTQHRLRRMVGRSPNESHRSATPLELLFDLTLVVAFAQAGRETAHLIAEGHVGSAIVAFAFVVFAVIWAWINFSWFASAYDTDDWFYRVTTMVQMTGVLVLALGIPDVFESIDRGEQLNNTVVVAGYVVMRVAMLAQWIRVAIQDPKHRRIAVAYAFTITIAQVGWTSTLFLGLSLAGVTPLLVILYGIELVAPVLAERRAGGTPWHPHHIAERYGLLVIITLGEGILGTIAAVSALVSKVGWSSEAVLVAVAGTGLTFGLWWNYFILPSAEVLERHRERSFAWGYGHIPLLAAIAAVGAGMHVAAYVVEGEATIGVVGAVLATAIPVAVGTLTFIVLYSFLVRGFDLFHAALFVGTLAVLGLAVFLAANGLTLGWSLIVVMLSPVVTIVGFEAVGHRHMAAALERTLA
ncbi:low temperature requirement protein A [Pseudolysinimonas sp.]|uniref:low temperature requirement protein A n=1 Tax=Pseudolysinimonas sp. TaxID=2680009 RepID=UPI00286D095E|nr:low temperature requirement protein A [Pseudolysinimonas sp.]